MILNAGTFWVVVRCCQTRAADAPDVSRQPQRGLEAFVYHQHRRIGENADLLRNHALMERHDIDDDQGN